MKRYKVIFFMLLACLSLVLFSCQKKDKNKGQGVSELSSNGAYPMTIKHHSGETTLEKEPQRIVVIDTAALDIIDSIGAGSKVVGAITQGLPASLSKYAGVKSCGSQKEPNMETIALLEPDLVFIGNRLSKSYKDFASHWKTIDSSVQWTDITSTDTYSNRVLENILMVSKAVGYEEEGKKVHDEIASLIETYKDMGKGKGKAMVLMSNGGEISMHGIASRWAPIFEVFGFENVDYTKADEGHKGQKISFETVQEINPDWIFVLDRDVAVGSTKTGETAKSVLDNALIHSTNAYKKGHVVFLGPQEWYIVMTGANNFKSMLNDVAKALK